jgi:hypothetical protein
LLGTFTARVLSCAEHDLPEANNFRIASSGQSTKENVSPCEIGPFFSANCLEFRMPDKPASE